MAYSGSTVNLITQGIGGTGKVFHYTNTDAAATIDASGYVTDAKQRGLVAGDLVLSQDSNDAALITSGHTVVAINSDNSADLSNGTTVAGASNGD